MAALGLFWVPAAVEAGAEAEGDGLGTLAAPVEATGGFAGRALTAAAGALADCNAGGCDDVEFFATTTLAFAFDATRCAPVLRAAFDPVLPVGLVPVFAFAGGCFFKGVVGAAGFTYFS